MTTLQSFLFSPSVGIGILAAAFWRDPLFNVLPEEQRRA